MDSPTRPGARRLAAMAAAILLVFAPWRSAPGARPPDEDDARKVVLRLMEAVRAGTLGPDEVARWFGEPPEPFRDAPDGPDFDRRRIVAALAPDGPLGRVLAPGPAIDAVVSGPDYVRVVLATQPMVSLILHREGGRVVVSRWETTRCGACGERERFVRDLVADVEAGDRPRLVPGIDLLVSDDTLTSEKGTWRFAWAARNTGAGYLRRVLQGAVVEAVRGTEVEVALEHQVETWTAVYRNRRWMLDYDRLPADSALRLAEGAYDWWRDGDRIRRDALGWWRPRSAPTPDGGVLWARHAVAVGSDAARDRWTVALERMDRRMAGLFLLEADGSVAGRYPLPTWPEHVPEVTRGWPEWWRVVAAPGEDRVFLSADDRAWIVPLERGEPVPVARLGTGRIRAAAWPPDGQAVLVGDERGSVTRIDGASGVAGATMRGPEGEVVGIDVDADRVIVAWSGGEVRVVRPERLETEQATVGVCCGSVAGLALLPQRGEALVACGPDACEPRAAARVSTVSDDPPVHYGDAWLGRGGVVSTSPDGRWVVLPAATGSATAVLCEAATLEPAAFFSHVPLVDVAWNARSDGFLALREDGSAVQWRVADLRVGVPEHAEDP